MKIKLKIKKKMINKSEFMKYYKKDQVVEFCKVCNNFMKNHSCPEFDFSTDDYLKPYKWMLVILTEIDTKVIQNNIEYFRKKVYESDSSKKYGNDERDESQFFNMLSVYIFEAVKKHMSEKLLSYESTLPDSLGLYPGSCSICSICEKENGGLCKYPSMMRYSLEALGFMVSDFYSNVFNDKLMWAEGKLPEKLTTCSGLLFVSDTHKIEGVFGYDEIIEL